MDCKQADIYMEEREMKRASREASAQVDGDTLRFLLLAEQQSGIK